MNEIQVHLRLSGELHKEVAAYADTYGTSVAAAIRILIRKGLALEESQP